MSLAATAILVVMASLEGSAIKIVSFSVFGATMTLLYTVSCLYHGLRKERLKRVFHIFDHAAIFVLIAGTYTPVALIAFGGGWGWSLFGILWGLAALGVVLTTTMFEKARYFSIALYIAMGWLGAMTGPKLISSLSAAALAWLILGGVFYTTGVLFYRSRWPFHHLVWHLFVVAGSVCHFFMMLDL